MTAIPLPFPLAMAARSDRPLQLVRGPSLSEVELLAAVRRGDESAWRSLVEKHEGAVASVVIGMLGPGDEADDVGQETFIRCYRAIGSFRGESSIRTWLQRIATNLSLNALKRRKRGLQRFLDLDDADEAMPQLQHDAVARQAALTDVEMVRAALAALPDKHRPVVVLRMIEGYSTRETAELLGVPEGTVLSRLSRALEQLKRVLAPMMHAEATEVRDVAR